jgi:hypothetical protein
VLRRVEQLDRERSAAAAEVAELDREQAARAAIASIGPTETNSIITETGSRPRRDLARRAAQWPDRLSFKYGVPKRRKFEPAFRHT